MNGSGGLIIRCQAADAVAQRLERLRCALNELKCSVEDDDASSEGAAFELPEAATYHRLQDELSRGIEALSFDICEYQNQIRRLTAETEKLRDQEKNLKVDTCALSEQVDELLNESERLEVQNEDLKARHKAQRKEADDLQMRIQGARDRAKTDAVKRKADAIILGRLTGIVGIEWNDFITSSSGASALEGDASRKEAPRDQSTIGLKLISNNSVSVPVAWRIPASDCPETLEPGMERVETAKCVLSLKPRKALWAELARAQDVDVEKLIEVYLPELSLRTDMPAQPSEALSPDNVISDEETEGSAPEIGGENEKQVQTHDRRESISEQENTGGGASRRRSILF